MHDLITTEAAPQQFSIAEMRELAGEFSKCGLFACKTQEQAFALMMLCQSEGIHAVQAMKRYHLIEANGRVTPSMRADAMQSDFQSKGGRVEWIRTDDEECVAKFSHPIHQPTPLEIRRTLKRYMENGTAIAWKDGKQFVKDNWKKSPDAMLRARVISAGVRAVLPGVVTGIYTPEEVRDFEDESKTAPPSNPASPIVKGTPRAAATTPKAESAQFTPVKDEVNPVPASDEIPPTGTKPASAMDADFTPAQPSPAAQTAPTATAPPAGRGQPQPAATAPAEEPQKSIPLVIHQLVNTEPPDDVPRQRQLMTQIGIEIAKRNKDEAEAIKADWKNAANAQARLNIIEKAKRALLDLCR